jgi:hypothetical protein
MPFEQPFPSTDWQARFRPASFRGVPFDVTGADKDGRAARRAVLCEDPIRRSLVRAGNTINLRARYARLHTGYRPALCTVATLGAPDQVPLLVPRAAQ